MRNVIEIPVTPIESLCIMVEKDCGVKMCGHRMEGRAQRKIVTDLSAMTPKTVIYI